MLVYDSAGVVRGCYLQVEECFLEAGHVCECGVAEDKVWCGQRRIRLRAQQQHERQSVKPALAPRLRRHKSTGFVERKFKVVHGF